MAIVFRLEFGINSHFDKTTLKYKFFILKYYGYSVFCSEKILTMKWLAFDDMESWRKIFESKR